MPRAILLGLGGVTLLYLAIQFVAQGTLGASLAGSATPLADAAGKAAIEGAEPMTDNGYKVDLVTTLVRRTVASLA